MTATRALAVAILMTCAGAPAQTLRTESVLPLATDPAINGWFGAHFAALDTATTRRGLLFIYIHGQGGTGSGATELVKTAAEQRFHAIGVTYPNDWSPFVQCQGNGDPDCAEKLRRELIEGVDHSPLVSISPANSLQNRIVKLLAYLDGAHPGEGWGQYAPAGQIDWSRVVLWGHSQGGGNAGIIARHHALARVCTSAPAADGGPGSPAPWWATHATPASSYFGFCHAQDSLPNKVAFWNAIGTGPFGAVADVASTPAPFAGTHQLSTSVPPANGSDFHNSVISDAITPRTPGGVPVYKPVWAYMLSDGCAANCDGSTASPALNVSDFTCFLQRYALGDPYANCDGSTAAPTLNVADFTCFLARYAAGCPGG